MHVHIVMPLTATHTNYFCCCFVLSLGNKYRPHVASVQPFSLSILTEVSGFEPQIFFKNKYNIYSIVP